MKYNLFLITFQLFNGGVHGSVWFGFGVKPKPNRKFWFLEKPKPFGFSVFGFMFGFRFSVQFSVYGLWFSVPKPKTKNIKKKNINILIIYFLSNKIAKDNPISCFIIC